jgi:hypothetical protein
MNRQILNKLDKVLALADSDQNGEALAAVRMARELLKHDGLSFGDLARVASQTPRPENRPVGVFTGTRTSLENELIGLRQRLEVLQAEMRTQDVDVQHWRQRAGHFEQQLSEAREETRRWRQLARDTVEKLWDLSLAVQAIDRDIAGGMPEKPE